MSLPWYLVVSKIIVLELDWEIDGNLIGDCKDLVNITDWKLLVKLIILLTYDGWWMGQEKGLSWSSLNVGKLFLQTLSSVIKNTWHIKREKYVLTVLINTTVVTWWNNSVLRRFIKCLVCCRLFIVKIIFITKFIELLKTLHTWIIIVWLHCAND